MSWSNPIPVPGLDQITNIRYNINTSGPNFFTYDLFRPSATTGAVSGPTAPVSVAPPIPDASLAGQAWGWPIPITAGDRPGLPGRRVRARLTKQPDGHQILDALISFGWRAEIMAGFDPADFDATKLLANGVDIWLKDVFTFPGGSVTIYDGLQTSAIWSDIDSDKPPHAHIFHILADVRGLPLAQFKDQVPDSWSLHCEDVAGSSSFTGIRPKFGPAHYSGISLSTTSTADDTASGSGTALSLDRIPPGRTVSKVRVVTAGTDSRVGFIQELSAGDPTLSGSPGFGNTGSVLRRDGSIYDGFPRAGPGLTWGTGSYLLLAYDSTTGKWWVGSTDATGSSPVWYGNPAAGTGEAWSLNFSTWSPHAAVFGSGGEVFEFLQPVASEIPVGFTAYSPDPSGITLARWLQLAAGLSTDLKGKLTVADDIDDVWDSFFFVDSQSTFNRDAMAACAISGCFMREDNASIHIGRGVNGTSFSVDLAVPAARLLRTSGESALTLSRSSEQDLPAEVRVQAISSEKADKFTEQKARWERGPKPTSVSTRSESYRVQAGMTVNLMQTYASRTLDRMTESRDKASYKLPWQDAIAVQPGNIHTVPEDDLLYTVMVTQASREANRIVAIESVRLHVAQDYQGTADVGTGFANPVALPTVTGTITGSITPTGSIHASFLGAADGVIVGSMSPIGSLNATASPPGATGTITGSMSPTGSLTGTATSPVVITTWNPSDKSASVTLSSGNSVATNTAFSWHAVRAVAGKSSGKWAFRVTPVIGATPEVYIGIATATASLSVGVGQDNNAYGYGSTSGNVYKNGSVQATYFGYSSGQTIDVCVDLDNNRMWVRSSGGTGNWNNSGTADPATNTGGLDISSLAGTKYPAWNGYNASDSATLASFSPMPSGFSIWG